MNKTETPPKSRLTRLWSWLRLLMGVLGLILLFTIVDLDEVSEAIADAELIYLFPAWLLLFASMAAKTARWIVLLRQNGVKVSFQRLFGTYLIGSFYSQFLPGSAAGGDAMRMAESSLDTGRAVDSVASVVIERGVGLTSIVTTASLILLLSPHPGIPETFQLVIHFLAIAGITGLAILRFGWFVEPLARLLTRFKLGKIADKGRSLSSAFRGNLGEPRVLASMVVLSLLANFFSMSAFYLALVAITDPVPYFDFISLVALIVTIEAIPLTPGSLGIRESAYIFFLGYLDINDHDALIISLLIRVLTWTQALIGGLVLLERGLRSSESRPTPAPDPSSRI